MVRIVCVFSGLFYPARHGLILLVFLMVILVASPLVVAVGTIVMGATALWVSARHNQRGILVASQMGFHAVCQAGVSNTTRELRLPHQLSARSRVMPILTAVGGVTAGVLSLMRTYVGAPLLGESRKYVSSSNTGGDSCGDATGGAPGADGDNGHCRVSDIGKHGDCCG